MDMVLTAMPMEIRIQANINKKRKKDMDAFTSKTVKNTKGCIRMVIKMAMGSTIMQMEVNTKVIGQMRIGQDMESITSQMEEDENLNGIMIKDTELVYITQSNLL